MSKEINMKQMSLLEDSPVNRSVSQEKEKESMTIDTSGMKLLESLENVNPDGSLAKMLKVLLTSTTAWYSDRCKLIWKKKVSKSNVLLFQLQASVLGTKENEFGLWATPNTMDTLPPRSKEGIVRQMTTARKGRTKPANLREQVDQSTMKMYGWMYPTPSAQEAGEGEFLETLTSKDGTPLKPNERAYNPKTNKHVQMTLNRMVKMFPTPTAGCIEGGEQSSRIEMTESGGFILRKKNKPEMTFGAKLSDAMIYLSKMYPTPTTDSASERTKKYKQGGTPLPVAVQMEQKKPGGKLNPEFVEFLMGYPLNWTKVEITE
jgi:hypothetical protein